MWTTRVVVWWLGHLRHWLTFHIIMSRGHHVLSLPCHYQRVFPATPCHCQRVFLVIQPRHSNANYVSFCICVHWTCTVMIRPRGRYISRFVVISNFQRWCGGHVVCVGVSSSLNLDDKWLISYSLATTNRSQVQTEGHVPNKRLILQFFIQSLWYAMCPRVGGIRLNLD